MIGEKFTLKVEEEMKKLFVIALVLIAVPAFAQQTACYSWEDGGTVLGTYGDNAVDALNVTGPQTGLTGDVAPGTWSCPGAYEGDNYLHVAESPHSGTPQFYIAWITGLVEGDNVAATYWGWDSLDRVSTNGEPALRIWAHYSSGTDINAYAGSHGGGNNNTGYTVAVGWQPISADWDIAAGQEALVIELRCYSYDYTMDPDRTDYWADYVCVTAPEGAVIHFPEGGSPVENESWTNIKALYR